ncbi:MAG: tRNA/rRNA methyltransferase [Candidatus Tokpelaia sp. JSC085]|nr:MAG: tRNA/rRNA methyltransferase [Candidatus Tokpelaia sp. JSC085]
MVETAKQRTPTIKDPVIILIEPQLPENIGMVARAMANFGLTELRLVNPRAKFPCKKANATARRAGHVIKSTVVFKTLHHAVSDLNYVLATTARARHGFKPVSSAAEAAYTLRLCAQNKEKTGILFGRECFGLSNDEISLADGIITFPVSTAFTTSLNIAQAVLLMSYEWMKSSLEKETQTCFRSPSVARADKDILHGFFSWIEARLDVRGYFRPPERKETMITNLRAVLTRAGFSNAEIRLLRGVISSLDRFSFQRQHGSDAPERKGMMGKYQSDQ